jgi:hypothetical protein
VDRFAASPKKDRQAFFRETAEQMDLSVVAVEKDFWVCWTLSHLFALPNLPPLLFKGGTSLSKCFNIIKRFSEDIDLTLDCSQFGFEGANDPVNMDNRRPREKRIKALVETCQTYVSDTLRPAIKRRFDEILPKGGWELRDGIVLEFNYPPSLADDEYGGASYLAKRIKLEIGPRSSLHPSKKVDIEPYTAKQFPDQFTEPQCTVTALSPSRTFWEKALMLFELRSRFEAEKAPDCKEKSRHMYDLAMIARDSSGKKAINDTDLFGDVVHHASRMFRRGGVDYARAVPGSFEFVPADELETRLRKDYAGMEVMFFDEAPNFDDLLSDLRRIESQINS